MSLSFKNQQGLAFIPLVFTLTLLFIVISLTAKIVPVYLNHNKVVAMLEQLKQETANEKKTESDIKSSLTKRININNIDDIAQDDITLNKQGNVFKVFINYEVVKKIFGNMSVLMEFNDEIEVRVE
jgi:cell division protein FtsL